LVAATLAPGISSRTRADVLGKVVVDIKSWVNGRVTAEEVRKEITAQKELATLDPALAAHVYPQIVSVAASNSFNSNDLS
jgi:hypothetical protein